MLQEYRSTGVTGVAGVQKLRRDGRRPPQVQRSMTFWVLNRWKDPKGQRAKTVKDPKTGVILLRRKPGHLAGPSAQS
jgi:hypothetical protein